MEDSINPVELRELVAEQSIIELLDELGHVAKEEEEFLDLLYLEVTSCSQIDLDKLALLAQLRLMESDEMILQGILNLCQTFIAVPRPYEQHYTTQYGVNRITSSNFEAKFEGLDTRFFRFTGAQIKILIQALKIPEFLCLNGQQTTALEALCILFHKSASHCRYVDMVFSFDLLPNKMSQIFNGMSMWISQRWGHLVRTFQQPFTTDFTWLDQYASSIMQAGCPLADVVGFGDCSCIPVARPVRSQRAWYCGHHGHHCFKTLVIVYPNGLMVAFGPFNGARHDSNAATQISLDELMIRHCSFEGRDFLLYLDAGFGIGQATITPFRRGRRSTPEQAAWNREMSRSRIVVEWGLGRVKEQWKFLTNKANLKTLLQPVAIYFFNSVLFTNLLAIFNGSQVQSKFEVQTPTLEEYLALPSQN